VVWIEPREGGERVASVEAWTDPGWERLPESPPVDLRGLFPKPPPLTPPYRPPA
jgi:hypothetical protein